MSKQCSSNVYSIVFFVFVESVNYSLREVKLESMVAKELLIREIEYFVCCL